MNHRMLTWIFLLMVLVTTPHPGLFAQGIDPDRVIKKEVFVPAPIDSVWQRWTTSEGGARMFGAPSVIELRPGGKYEIYFNPQAPEGSRGSEGCTVLSYLHGRMLSFTWNAPLSMPELRKERTWVVVNFVPAGAARTIVRMTHTGWKHGGEWDKGFEYFTKAWDYVLTGLKASFSPAETVDTLKTFIYMITPVRNEFFDAPTQEEMNAMGVHFGYLKKLTKEGTVITAGPMLDKTFGIAVFRAASEAEAREIMNNDPSVKAGVMKAELHPYRMSLVSQP